MRNIQPVDFPIVGEATKLKVQVQHFGTTDLTCTLRYEVLTEENKICTVGDYQLTEQEYEGWGVDNSYLDELIATKLGVVLLPII